MKTDAIYLVNSYLQEMDAQVLEVFPEGDKRWRVLLDKTVFYPMGGGQPTDQGKINDLQVYQVMMKDGEIWHYVQSDTAPVVGDTVHGKIDWQRRFQNMSVHSGGHVVDFAMYQLGYSPEPLQPVKGDHSKKSFIVYACTLGKDITHELEDKSNELVTRNISFTTAFVPLEELQKDAIYLQPGLPTNKPLRKLTLEGVGSVADGGTQVKTTGEVGKISIPSVTEENGNTIVTYRVE